MKIVLGVFIGWKIVSILAKNVSRLGFVTVENLKNHQKRVTIHHFEKISFQRSCHILANVSRFYNVERTSILT